MVCNDNIVQAQPRGSLQNTLHRVQSVGKCRMTMCFTQDQMRLFIFQIGNGVSNSGIKEISSSDICERFRHFTFFESPGLCIVIWEKLLLFFSEEFSVSQPVHMIFLRWYVWMYVSFRRSFGISESNFD